MNYRLEHGIARTADGLNIAYQASGQGPAFVCCHAMAWDHSMWDGHREAFSRDFRLITFDQRGASDSDHPAFAEGPDCAYSVEGFGEDLRAVLDATGVEKAHVLGYSMGNVAALSFATRWPERVECLVLASVMASRFPEEIINRARSIEQVLDEDGLGATYEYYFSGPLFENMKGSEFFRQSVERVQRKATPDGFKGCFRVTIDRPSMIDDLHRIQAPTLVIVGERDTHYLAEADLITSIIPNARKLLVKDAGHTLAMQKPDVFENAVLDFIDQTTSNIQSVAQP